MRFGNSAKPFERFLETLLVIAVAANLTVLVLLFLGIIKAPGHMPPRMSRPAPTPADYLPGH